VTTATSTRAVPPRRRLGREQRRASIIAASAQAFARGGFVDTSMADIAHAAGVTHLIIYRHFDSKQRLYVALLEAATDRLESTLEESGAIGAFGPTPAALLACARADEPGFRILWHHAPHEPQFASWVEAAKEVVETATRGALSSLTAPADRRWAVRATSSYVIDAVLHWVDDGDPALDDRFVAATTAALRAGVRSWSRDPRSTPGARPRR